MSASVLPPCTSEMGVSQVERLGGGPSLNNAMLREILGRGGGGGAAVGQPLHFSPSSAAEEETPADLRCAPLGGEDADEEMATSRPSSPAEKRSRLESIVSHMQSSPQPVVNGCKKRKLYQPVQHETTTQASGTESEPEQEQESTQEQESRKEPEPGVMRKLNTVRSQLSVMQERYSQLYKEQARRRSSSGVMGPSPDTSPDPARPVQLPATPTRPDHLPPSSFIDYARRVLNADPRNREQEKISQPPPGVEPAARHATPADVEGLADALKAELSSSLTGLIDSIVSKWSRDRRAQAKAAEMTEQMSPRAEILRRISQHNGRFPGPFAASELPFGLSLSALRPPVNLPPLYPQKPFQATMSTPSYGSYGLPPFCPSQPQEQESPLSLVVTPKRKRHKLSEGVMDPLAGSESPPSPPAPVTPLSRPSQPPLSLPSSAAESAYFSSYPYHRRAVAGSPPRGCDSVSPPSHPPTLLHPALLAAGRRSPPDGRAFRATPDRSDCSSLEGGFDAQRSFLGKTDVRSGLSLTADFSSTLTPLHLRKAKLMFYWTRYPSSTVLKSYFPDINFNKNNTAQLVKWFSNFREFFYIQMEKHARLALSEGIKSPEELHVTPGCELLRVLNLHYNRNNHIEIPVNFPPLAESALREFFRAIQEGKDAEPSWKKAIYKVISRLDENVPEYFRSSSFLEQLE